MTYNNIRLTFSFGKEPCPKKIFHPTVVSCGSSEKPFLFLSICAGGLHCLDAFILPINPQADISQFFFGNHFHLFHLEPVRGTL